MKIKIKCSFGKVQCTDYDKLEPKVQHTIMCNYEKTDYSIDN